MEFPDHLAIEEAVGGSAVVLEAHVVGRAILRGDGFVLQRGWVITQPGQPTAYGGALYPLFVAAIYGATGNAFPAVVAVQILLSVAAVVLRGMLVNFLVWVPILAAMFLLSDWFFRIKPVTDFFETWFPLERTSNLDWDLFDVALWIAVGVGLLFVVVSTLYSLGTWFDSILGGLRYRSRRWFEATFSKLVAILMVLVIVVLLPQLFPIAKTGLS
ncbi:MAG: hypothetical protein IH820_00350, partial [Bacteroidetes bacterium]|nr:hypothetical protein [Bacteroidota bacterium]